MVKKRENINIPLSEIITSVSTLGDRVSELDEDGKWRSNNSLWADVAGNLAGRLSIENTIEVRKYVYTKWHRKSSKLRLHFIGDERSKETSKNLQELPSIPSYEEINTRLKYAMSSNTTTVPNEPKKHLIEFSYEEWRSVNSC